MVNKVVASLVSLILVVGVVLGVVAVVHHSGSSKNVEAVSASMKAVATMCAPTPFKDACMLSLSPVAKNVSATPKDFILAALQATIDEVKKSMDAVAKVKVNNETDPTDHMEVEDCKELLQYAIGDLQASFSMVGNQELHTIGDRVRELLNWLTAVYGYQTSCYDQIQKPEYRNAMQNGVINATQLTNNAIYILSDISEILKGFNIPINFTNAEPGTPSSSSRKLLEVTELGHDGYPTWLSVSDRKLLDLRGRGRRGGRRRRGGRGRRGVPLAGVRPNAVVAQDGSEQFRSIKAALAAYPKNLIGRYVVYVKAGVYDEQVIVEKHQKNVFMFGDGPARTIVTGHRNFGKMKIATKDTATFAALGEGFIAKSMKFENTAGPDGHQAVALRVLSDRSAIVDCRIEGYQDSLYYHQYRQFYRNCLISGTVDFIFGKGAAVIQNSVIVVRRPGPSQQNTITADGREDPKHVNGLVIQNSRIVAERALFLARFQIPTYMGRPWKAYSLTVIKESELGDLIRPEGWMPWAGERFENTCTYAEYNNRGPGANVARRVRWRGFHVITNRAEADRYNTAYFIDGGLWLRSASVPFY